MNYSPSNSYSSVSRAAKGFEVTSDQGAIVDANFVIPRAEAERVFGTNGTVPEGTIVAPYTVGTTVGTHTTVAGDLKIITNGWDEFWGVTLTEVRDFTSSNNNRYDHPLTVSYGERVAVATGIFNAVTQNFNLNAQSIVPAARMYAGASGAPTLDDGTVYATGSGRLFAAVIEEGFIEYDARTGNPLVAASGGIADEIYIKAYCNKMG
jgi:hypothetical protein